jgi:hypothetical protein
LFVISVSNTKGEFLQYYFRGSGREKTPDDSA